LIFGARKNFFEKNKTFFKKGIDKLKGLIYNILRYPKTAGSRKSWMLSCRGEIITL
jgi:hypothetical protein